MAGTVGITLLQTRGESTTAPGCGDEAAGRAARPLFLEFGVRGDRQAQDLSRAASLLNNGKVQQAGAIFARYHSLQAEIGAAFASWPDGGLDELKRLVAAHPESPAAQFNLGMAYYWSGRVADAASTWQRVASRYPDSPESVEAENVLYPKLAPGLPPIVTTIAEPSAPSRAAQLRLLARAARAAGRDREASVRPRALAALAPRVGGAAIRRRREARAERSGSADRGRGRRVHEAGAGSGVRPARAADGRVPARRSRPFPPRDPARLDPAACESAQTIPSLLLPTSPGPSMERRRRQFVAALRQHGTK